VKKQLRDLLKPTISLFLICLVVSAALAFTYAGTKDIIADRARLDAENARREVLAEADRFATLENIDSITSSRPELSIVKEAYKAFKGDSVTGYVFVVESKGYGGDIQITVGINNDGKITGVKIGENNETPGLGTKASEAPFKTQFENITPQEPLKLVKGNKAGPEEIDAISGATVTSKAVVKGVQAAVDVAYEIRKEEGSWK
jgi:electron transport complex protein RnfG